MANLRNLSIASASAGLIVLGMAKTATAADMSGSNPLFEQVDSYTTTIAANNDVADIYYPKLTDLNANSDSFPVALLLQGANVDKSDYSNFANTVASYGFVVVVPNHPQSLPEFGFTGLLPDTSQIEAVQAQMVAENSNSASPITGIVDTQKLALLGHSAGGAVGLSAIADICLPVLCQGDYNRPDELVAGAFFGANLRNQNTQEFIPINNSGIPIALLQGTDDSIALPERAERTYEQIQTPPKALVEILGANHYGITNTNNPVGPIADGNAPTIPQDEAVETVGRWSGLFLRASVLDDKEAFNYVYFTGDAVDENVNVISQATPVPEPPAKLSVTVGLLAFGIWGTVLSRKKRQQQTVAKVSSSVVQKVG